MSSWQFFNGFILFYQNLSICKKKWIAMNMWEQFLRAPYNYLIIKLNICNIPLSESEEYDMINSFDVWKIVTTLFPMKRCQITLFSGNNCFCVTCVRVRVHTCPHRRSSPYLVCFSRSARPLFCDWYMYILISMSWKNKNFDIL